MFGVAYQLQDAPEVRAEDRESLRDVLAWFENHLTTPDRFNRSGSKGYYRRRTCGIAWFRDSADECISRMHILKRILEAYGHSVQLVREDRVGYIVYEDDVQVVAEPFSATRTGG